MDKLVLTYCPKLVLRYVQKGPIPDEDVLVHLKNEKGGQV